MENEVQHHFVKKSATLPIQPLSSALDGNGGWLESIKANFSANLKRLMRDRGLTGDQLATRLGVSSRSVYEWTRGNGLPKIDRLDDIAVALKTNFIELVRDPEVPLERQLAIEFIKEIALKLDHKVVKGN
jgi:DNA-binding XRE family transcriptional regulator